MTNGSFPGFGGNRWKTRFPNIEMSGKGNPEIYIGFLMWRKPKNSWVQSRNITSVYVCMSWFSVVIKRSNRAKFDWLQPVSIFTAHKWVLINCISQTWNLSSSETKLKPSRNWLVLKHCNSGHRIKLSHLVGGGRSNQHMVNTHFHNTGKKLCCYNRNTVFEVAGEVFLELKRHK